MQGYWVTFIEGFSLQNEGIQIGKQFLLCCLRVTYHGKGVFLKICYVFLTFFMIINVVH